VRNRFLRAPDADEKAVRLQRFDCRKALVLFIRAEFTFHRVSLPSQYYSRTCAKISRLIFMFWFASSTHCAGRDTRDDGIWRNIPGDDGACPDYCAFADREAAQDRRVRSDRGTPADPGPFQIPVTALLQLTGFL